MRISTTFRRSLITNIVVLLMLLGGAITALQYYSSKRVVRGLSGELTSSTLSQTEDGLRQFFAPVDASLELAVRWGREHHLVNFPIEQVFSLYAPFLDQVGYISSALLADETGREIMVLRREDGTWYVREIDPTRDGVQRVMTYDNQEQLLTDRLVEIDYSPTSRPWFVGAMEQLDAAPPGSTSGEIFWTEPYEFFTTREPGITASKAFVAGGKSWVVAFDVLLMDISAFTTTIEVSANGMVIVTDEKQQVVGLPRNPRFEKINERSEALLKFPEDIGLPVINDALICLQEEGATDPEGLPQTGAFRFYSDGEAWWSQVAPFDLGNRSLFIAVLLPESDLLGGLLTERFTVIGILLVVLTLAVMRARWLGSRFAEPVEQLAIASDRISRLTLDESVQIESHVKEIHHLVGATERMRESLQNLLKLERDLQTARQIQQATFPEFLPKLEATQLAAYSEPADETGGDSYDLIGLNGGRLPESGADEETKADSVLLLLADATGHGVGPALSVTQVRSMVRMGARVGTPLDELAEHMNEQLCEDLSQGRFVTMWLGHYTAATGELWSLSAGQGPLLLYRARTGEFEEVGVDTTPLGIMRPLPELKKRVLKLEPGDVFAVLSDGVYEAVGEANSMFGQEAVERSIKTHARGDASQILDAIRTDCAVFTGGRPARDDHTGIIIKRTN
ncbi:MAG: serine phosphatase RsbU (regulator of sigma subunit) [Phycisphaerales bacterium]|jgi:serine phosphatase RsbU (regulator of sigma subunit)